MKELILLSLFFSFGIGKQNQAIHELLDLKGNAERSLLLVKETNEYYQLIIQALFTELSEKTCIDLKVLDDDYSNYTTSELKKITLPINDWISRMSKHMRALNIYLNQLQIYKDSIESDLPIRFPDLFFGDCGFSFPKKLPQKNINTNDIYDYQNNIYCGESEGFQCGSGECIDSNRTCDGKFDCWDGSDELGTCEEKVGCELCPKFCALGPRGPRCLAECPAGLQHSMRFCPNSKPCYSLCLQKSQHKGISTKCLVRIISNLMDTTYKNFRELLSSINHRYLKLNVKCQEQKNLATADKTNSLEEETTASSFWYSTTRHPTWHPTTRHPTSHPTTRHPTWHPTTRHPTWHPTTRHPTWHTTTRHPTWHPTTRHPTWHPTTRHTTWHPTTRHPTWHPTTRHPTWHPTTRHPTWHTTTRHPTWHTTTRHPTWHPTTRHPTWHPTTQHPTWHPTTRHTTWNPAFSDSLNESDYLLFEEKRHHTTKHTTPHSTTPHGRTTRHHTTKHTTKHTTHHTTKHTTKHTTHHTTTPTPTTPTTTTTTTAKSTAYPSSTTRKDGPVL